MNKQKNFTPPKIRKLSVKQQNFIKEAIKDISPRKAAINAGYSQASASQAAQMNLKDPRIKKAIRIEREAAAERANITIDRVTQEISRIAFSNLQGILSADGGLINPHDWTPGTAAAIASFELAEETTYKDVLDENGDISETQRERIVTRTIKAKTWNKNEALEKLARHLGMMNETIEHTGPGGGPIPIIVDTGIQRPETPASIDITPEPEPQEIQEDRID